MTQGLEGKRVVVSAGGGIGKATAKAYLAAGPRVHLAATGDR